MDADSEPPYRPSKDELPSASGWNCIDFSWVTKPPIFVVGIVYATAGLITLFVVVAGLVVLAQFLGQVLAIAPKDFEDTSKRLLAIGVIVAAPFAIWRILISHWQSRAARAQAAAADRQADTSREAHFTTLFTKAIELLGATREEGTHKAEPNMEVRLGAIYALERIAHDSTRDHWPIMETLCAYVRENAGPPQTLSANARNSIALHRMMGASSPLDEESKSAEQQRPRADIQAALTVLGRRSADQRDHEAKLRADAVRKEWHGLDLRQTNLRGAVLDGLNFDYARFDGSSLAFASFQDTHLRHASFSTSGLENTEFARSKLEHADISVTHAEGARFRGAELSKVNARSAQLICAEFAQSDLRDASFASANMLGAIIAPSQAKGAMFIQSKLSLAVFRGLSLDGVIFGHDTSLRDVFFTQVQFEGVKYLAFAAINEAIADMRTTAGGQRPPGWPKTDDEFSQRVGSERGAKLKAALVVSEGDTAAHS